MNWEKTQFDVLQIWLSNEDWGIHKNRWLFYDKLWAILDLGIIANDVNDVFDF